jgi:hypothetical protein
MWPFHACPDYGMIYVDTSVALAQLLSEDRVPRAGFPTTIRALDALFISRRPTFSGVRDKRPNSRRTATAF